MRSFVTKEVRDQHPNGDHRDHHYILRSAGDNHLEEIFGEIWPDGGPWTHWLWNSWCVHDARGVADSLELALQAFITHSEQEDKVLT